VRLQGESSLVRGQLLLLRRGGDSGLIFDNADDVPLEEVRRFLGCVASRESPPPAPAKQPVKHMKDATTQTPYDGPSPLFADELLRCAADPARCTSTQHIMATVRQLALLRERQVELVEGSQEAEPPVTKRANVAGRRRDHPDDEAWASCLRAAVSAGPSGGKRPRAMPYTT